MHDWQNCMRLEHHIAGCHGSSYSEGSVFECFLIEDCLCLHVNSVLTDHKASCLLDPQTIDSLFLIMTSLETMLCWDPPCSLRTEAENIEWFRLREQGPYSSMLGWSLLSITCTHRMHVFPTIDYHWNIFRYEWRQHVLLYSLYRFIGGLIKHKMNVEVIQKVMQSGSQVHGLKKKKWDCFHRDFLVDKCSAPGYISSYSLPSTFYGMKGPVFVELVMRNNNLCWHINSTCSKLHEMRRYQNVSIEDASQSLKTNLDVSYLAYSLVSLRKLGAIMVFFHFPSVQYWP